MTSSVNLSARNMVVWTAPQATMAPPFCLLPAATRTDLLMSPQGPYSEASTACEDVSSCTSPALLAVAEVTTNPPALLV